MWESVLFFPVPHRTQEDADCRVASLLAMTDSELRSVLLSPVIPRRGVSPDVGICSLFPGPASHSKGTRIAASLRSSQ